jgi:predicted HicB family RNase H-like nuclease
MSVAMEKTARKRGRPKTSDRHDVTVRIDHRIAARAHYVAKSRGVSIAALLSDMLEQPINRAFADAGKRLETL